MAVSSHGESWEAVPKELCDWLEQALLEDRRVAATRHATLLAQLRARSCGCPPAAVAAAGKAAPKAVEAREATEAAKEEEAAGIEPAEVPGAVAQEDGTLDPCRPPARDRTASASSPSAAASPLEGGAPGCEDGGGDVGDCCDEIVCNTVSKRATTGSKGRSPSRRQMSQLGFFEKSGAQAPPAAPHGWRNCLHVFVASPWFETCFSFLIMLNVVVMAIEAQYKGAAVGQELGYPGYGERGTQKGLLPGGAEPAFGLCEWIFGVVYILEIILKLDTYRLAWAGDPWNWLDLFLVALWLLGVVSSLKLPVNPMLPRMLRLLRLLRLLKLVRAKNGFDPLFLMTTALKGSIGVLAWAVVLIVIVQMVVALCLQTVLVEFIQDRTHPEETRLEVYKYYGTFARTMLTMFEITLGNWMPPCRALVENVNEWWMLFSLCHKLVIGFSMVSVITGVFIQETFKVAASDDRIMMRHKERANKTHKQKMKALFEVADADGDGFVDEDEFQVVLSNPAVRTWLSAMELSVRDATALFRLLDPGCGTLGYEDLMSGVGELKGAARSIDVMQLNYFTQDVLKEVREAKTLLAGVNAHLLVEQCAERRRGREGKGESRGEGHAAGAAAAAAEEAAADGGPMELS